MRDIILLLVGFGAGYWYATRLRSEDRTSARQRKILEMLKEKGELTNDDVQKALGISDATATRYLDQLEKEGKIVQIGQEGRGVVYKLK